MNNSAMFSVLPPNILLTWFFVHLYTVHVRNVLHDIANESVKSFNNHRLYSCITGSSKDIRRPGLKSM